MTVLEYCEANNIDLSSFAKQGKSIVSSEDESVVYAIEELLDAGYSQAVIASALRLSANFVSKISIGKHHEISFATGKLLDTGKIKALARAGWTPTAISYDVGCDLNQVLEVLNKQV